MKLCASLIFCCLWQASVLLLALQVGVAHAESFSPRVLTTFQDSIAVGTSAHGVLLLDAKDFSLSRRLDVRAGLPTNQVLSLYNHSDERLIIGLEDGVCSFDTELKCKKLFQSPIYDAIWLEGTGLLLASERGVLKETEELSFELLYDVHEFASRKTLSLDRLGESGFCASKINGLSCFDGENFAVYQRGWLFSDRTPELTSNYFTSSASLSKTQIVAGTLEGISLISGDSSRKVQYQGKLLSEPAIRSNAVHRIRKFGHSLFLMHGGAKQELGGSGFARSTDGETWDYLLKSGQIYDLLQVSTDALLLARNRGLYALSLTTKSQRPVPPFEPKLPRRGTVLALEGSGSEVTALLPGRLVSFSSDTSQSKTLTLPHQKFQAMSNCGEAGVALIDREGRFYLQDSKQAFHEILEVSRNQALAINCFESEVQILTKSGQFTCVLNSKGSQYKPSCTLAETFTFGLTRPVKGRLFNRDEWMLLFPDFIPHVGKNSRIVGKFEGQPFDTFLPLSLNPEEFIEATTEEGRLYLLFHSTLLQFSPESGEFKSFTPLQRNDLFQGMQLAGDELLLLSRSGTLSKLLGNELVELRSQKNYVSAFHVDEKERLWLAETRQGVVVYPHWKDELRE